MPRHLPLIAFMSLLLVPGLSSAQVTQDSIDAYTASIEKHRTGKNIKMLYSEGTPLKPEQQKSFEGLHYYAPDITYAVTAELQRDTVQETVIMRTSTERAPEYIKIGKVTFALKGKELTLYAFQSKKLVEVSNEETMLFIPFRDATNGEETYGGGRYVDCEIPPAGNTILLDFNKAYNPYCAYNIRYSCVIPPEENRLEVRIEAGEKVFEAH